MLNFTLHEYAAGRAPILYVRRRLFCLREKPSRIQAAQRRCCRKNHRYSDLSDEIKIDGEIYKVTNNISNEELDEYLKILNAHNIQKIKTYVKFFFIIAVIAIIITIAAILPTISTIMQASARGQRIKYC